MMESHGFPAVLAQKMLIHHMLRFIDFDNIPQNKYFKT